MEEGIIATLENGARYYLVKETNDEGKRYFLGVGITDEDDVDYTEIALFLSEKENDDEYLTKIDPKSQEYLNVVTTQFYDNLINENPEIEEELMKKLQTIVEEQRAAE